MVESYLESSRTIIPAVIPASSDVETQTIDSEARAFDRMGERTVGILTKPDLINVDTEARVTSLINSHSSIMLKLGFLIAKNPTPMQLKQGITFEQRRIEESEFSNEPKWRVHNLDYERVGVDALRSFLQSILEKHIEKELPKVRSEILHLLYSTRRKRGDLGDERPTLSDQPLFL
jgi:hypothetical protein